MAAFLDGCRFNPAAGGTTDWTYSSAVTGYQSPAAANVVNGRLYKYRAESSDLSQWELGEGAYNTSTGVLARTTVLYNSSGGTSKINFTTVPQVAIVALKEDLLSVEEANTFTTTQQAQVRANIGVGGLKNLFRNGTMDVWQRGTSITLSSTATLLYSADGWLGDFAGAVGNISRVSNPRSGSPTLYGLMITGAAACTDASLAHRIESYIAARMNGQTVTVQAQITNNTGAAVTPALSFGHASAQDNFSTVNYDFSAVALQVCPNGVTTLVAYTFTPLSGVGNGAQLFFDFGNNFGSNTKTLTIAELDIQVTPGVATGLNSNPPVPEFRDVMYESSLCYRYFYAMPSAQYVFPAPNNTFACAFRHSFPVPMRAVPTVSTAYSGESAVSGVAALTRTNAFFVEEVVASANTNAVWTMSALVSAEL